MSQGMPPNLQQSMTHNMPHMPQTVPHNTSPAIPQDMPQNSAQIQQSLHPQQTQYQPQMHQQASPPLQSHISPQTGSDTPGSDSLAVDPSLQDTDEHPSKRQRLDESQDPSVEDEAVLNALAAHNHPSIDHYDAE
jgi:hypothetical protein